MDQYQQYMGMAGLPSMYYPMMQYPATQMESMYPRCYHVIYPRVKRMVDMFCYQNPMMSVTPAMMKQMTDSIYDEVEPMMGEDDMEEMNTQMMPETEEKFEDQDNMNTRQFGGGFFPGFFPRRRRRFLGDLIGILLLRELLGRRRRHGFGF